MRPSLRTRDARAIPAAAALAGAVALVRILRMERGAAAEALLLGPDNAPCLRAMRLQRRRAIRAHDAEILEAVVVGDAVDVVEDHAHDVSAPHLALSAEFADRLLETCVVQPLLEVIARKRRVLDEDFVERPASLDTRSAAGGVGVEVLSRDVPERRVLPQDLICAARTAHIPSRRNASDQERDAAMALRASS